MFGSKTLWDFFGVLVGTSHVPDRLWLKHIDKGEASVLSLPADFRGLILTLYSQKFGWIRKESQSLHPSIYWVLPHGSERPLRRNASVEWAPQRLCTAKSQRFHTRSAGNLST